MGSYIVSTWLSVAVARFFAAFRLVVDDGMKSVNKIALLFRYSAGVLLSLTATAKFISAMGGAGILHRPDPVFGIPFNWLFWIVGAIELLVSAGCFFIRRRLLSSGLVAWLATSFVVYRIGAWRIGSPKLCPCLGNITDALHISPQRADLTMKIVLAYLLVGSYGTVYWHWRRKRATPLPATTAEKAPARV